MLPLKIMSQCCEEEAKVRIISSIENDVDSNEVDSNYEYESEEMSNSIEDDQMTRPEDLIMPPAYADNYDFTEDFNFYNNFDLKNVKNKELKFLLSQIQKLLSKNHCKANHGCQHECEIINGKETCKCDAGYFLAYDGKNCCQSPDFQEFFGPKTEYVNPKCGKGFFLNDLNICEDNNECIIENNGCPEGARCVNTRGSYYCIPSSVCRKGFRYDERTKKCNGK